MVEKLSGWRTRCFCGRSFLANVLSIEHCQWAMANSRRGVGKECQCRTYRFAVLVIKLLAHELAHPGVGEVLSLAHGNWVYEGHVGGRGGSKLTVGVDR